MFNRNGIHENDYDLVDKLLDKDGEIEIKHRYGYDRMVDDIRDGLSAILADYYDTKELLGEGFNEDEYLDMKEKLGDQEQEIKKMKRHIKKLEGMLERRSIAFKRYEG